MFPLNPPAAPSQTSPLPTMLTAEQCRQILGEKAKHLTDKEVKELHDRLCALADVAIEQAVKELLPNSFPPLPRDQI